MTETDWAAPRKAAFKMGKINGLDLFSGIGGLSLALAPWVRPIAYCEKDRFCQAVLLSRMSSMDLSVAPIWDDVQTLRKEELPERPEIIYGGFPCQDVSSGGKWLSKPEMAGKRTALFQEIMRLAEETKPAFIFLENVEAIANKSLSFIAESISKGGYDCRWLVISAREVGACHLRKRWFCLANLNIDSRSSANQAPFCVPHRSETQTRLHFMHENRLPSPLTSMEIYKTDVVRSIHGVPNRVDRTRALGNAVVPIQAREAFKRLAGISQ